MSEPIPLNEAGVTRTVFAIRTLLIGLEFEESTHGELLSGMAAVLGLRTVGVGSDEEHGPFLLRIVAESGAT